MTALVDRHGLAPQAARAPRFSALVAVASPFEREMVSRTLRSLGAGDIIEASSVAEARARAHGTRRDLAVVEVGLPDGSGIGLIRDLRASGCSRGLVLSASEDPYTVRAALAGGVRAFLVSFTAGHRGTAGPHRAASRAPGLAALPTRARGSRLVGTDGLSGREVEVLTLVAEGRSNKEIGESLGLSALTVKSRLARIARKLGTGDRAEMVIVAMRAGVVN